MKDRLLELRTTLNMTTRAFADRLGLTGGAITNMEKGARNITDRTLSDICREFNVNEKWLRTGEGTMFIEIPRDEEIASSVRRVLQTESDSFKKRFISMLAQLSEDEWEHLEHYARRLVEPPEESEQLTIDEEVEAYREELEAERKGATLSPSDASGA